MAGNKLPIQKKEAVLPLDTLILSVDEIAKQVQSLSLEPIFHYFKKISAMISYPRKYI